MVTQSPDQQRSQWLYLLAFAVPFAILLVHAFYYYPFFADDAFISLRYAQRLLDTGELNWNDGEYVEGYSNLLWVLSIAFLGAFGVDLVAAGRVVGVLASAAAMAAFSYYHLKHYTHIASLFMTNCAFALCAPVAIWMIGGLEAALGMGLLAWAFILAHDVLEQGNKRSAFTVGLLLGLLNLTRPEAPIFTMAIALGIFVVSGKNRWNRIWPLAIMCFTSFIFFASQLGFRLAYYGDWVANTYYVKVAFTESRLINGLMYCLKGIASLLPLILVAVIKLDVITKHTDHAVQKRSFAFLVIVCAIWITILAVGGGDIFPGYRHILLIVPALILMVMHSLNVIYSKGNHLSTHLFYGYVLLCFIWLQVTFEENQKAREEGWVWDTKELALALKRDYGDQQALTAVTLAGVIPFFSGLPSIDMYGLNDAYITKHRDEDSGYGKFGEGFIGHELFNSKYVLSRKPDIIVFHAGNKAPLYGMGKEPEFIANYESRKIALPSYTAEIWLRKDSTKVHP
jgi:arabinofuranosyltransferase